MSPKKSPAKSKNKSKVPVRAATPKKTVAPAKAKSAGKTAKIGKQISAGKAVKDRKATEVTTTKVRGIGVRTKGKDDLKESRKPLPPSADLKYCYYFGGGKAEGTASMRDLLGGKGANLAEMTNLGIPVPAGFTISTDACRLFYESNLSLPRWFEKHMKEMMDKVEKEMGAKFGDPANPLLVSVRSGAKFSMPGMMDTILNLGLNDETLKGIINKTDNPRFAYDNYRRFISMFGNVVLGIDKDEFEELIGKKKKQRSIKHDASLSIDDLKEIVKALQETGRR